MSTEDQAVADAAQEEQVVDRGDEVVDKTTPDNPADPKEQEQDKGAEQTESTEADGSESGEDDKKGGIIPLDRHKDILERERSKRQQLEQQLEQYNRNSQASQVDDSIKAKDAEIAKMDADYQKLMLDGETEKAAALMQQIRAAEREVYSMQAQAQAQEIEARAVERARYDIVVERIESAYPELNPDSEEFNQDTLDEVIELHHSFVQSGKSLSDSLQRAVKYVMGAATGKQTTAVDVKPRVPAKDEDAAAKRKAEGAAKTAKAVSASAPSMGSAGLDSDKLGGSASNADVNAMSYKDFEGLSDAAKAKMRGDVL